MSTTQKPVWSGAKALRRSLVPISDLEPFPGNPRLGDVSAVSASIRRFGQLKPIVVDGSRIVAGHHIVKAMSELGMTHVAVVDNEFKDEAEARAFLLADNRTHDLGIGYDTALLVDQLRFLADADALDGTGYDVADIDAYVRSLAPPAEIPQPPTEPPPSDLQEIVLMFSREQVAQANVWMQVIEKELGASGRSEVFYSALEYAARALNA